MANLTYTNNGISFNNVTSTNTTGGTFIAKPKLFNSDDKDIDQETLSEYGLIPIIQGLQIDWNDAHLGNKVDSATLTPGEEIIIQTTGQLLSYMSTIAQKLTNLENILINL